MARFVIEGEIGRIHYHFEPDGDTPIAHPVIDVREDYLDLPMDEDKNDAGATTIRGYLTALLRTLWQEQDGFSGKRPFGNSGWTYDLYLPLIRAGVVRGVIDEDGYIDSVDDERANKVIADLIAALGQRR